MTYTIPAGVFHNTEVAPDLIHATLFFFDSKRGFHERAPVIGPVNGETHIQLRDPAGISAATLARVVDAVRQWEQLYDQGLQHTHRGEFEEALQSHHKALAICEHNTDFPRAPRYRHPVLGAIGHMNRMLGRYGKASQILEEAIREMPHSKQRVEATGELAVVYRHSNRLEDAKHACEEQYSTAQHLHSDKEMGRAIGNLGMINYQLFLLTGDKSLLDAAERQLTERVERSRRLKEAAATLSDPGAKAQMIQYASAREAIGLARLSLCHSAKGETKEAISTSLESLEVTFSQTDTTKIAFSRYFYGRALLLNGQKEEALAQFNPVNACTPIIALCKEPSDEHREYIKEMIEAGADLDLTDEQGYSALDCAVYCDDKATQTVLVEGLLRKHSQQEVDWLLSQSVLRKGYREIFQDRLRPVLLQAGDLLGLQNLRRVYADSLAADEQKQLQFDGLKFVRYIDMVRHGRIPKSTDNITQQFTSSMGASTETDCIVFISYRWINGARLENFTPDDKENTQYNRMLRALLEFLRLNPGVKPERLCLWIDWACVDQDNADVAARGIAALSMCIAQCDAMISLTDASYYERAWCCLEVKMIQVLRRSYKVHLWYEHVIDPTTGGECLRDGPTDIDLSIADTKLTLETDRKILLFLERQVKLLS